MNTAKIYHDEEGNEKTINQMVSCEPEWAASRIQAGEIDSRLYKELLSAVAFAYGYLWFSNNNPEPGMFSPEQGVSRARKILTNFLTSELKGKAINQVKDAFDFSI